MLDLVDRVLDEIGGVEHHAGLEPLGETGLELGHFGVHRLGGGDGVGAGRQKDGDGLAGVIIELVEAGDALRAQRDGGDILEAQQGSVGVGAQHDVAELGRGGQAAFGLDGELELLVVGAGLLADGAERGLDVLGIDGADDVGRGEAELGQAGDRVIDPHGIALGTKQNRLADARHAGQGIEHVDGDVVGDLQLAERIAGTVDKHEFQHRAGTLADGDAFLLNQGGQLAGGLLHRVGDVDCVDVGVGADAETDIEGVGTVIARG